MPKSKPIPITIMSYPLDDTNAARLQALAEAYGIPPVQVVRMLIAKEYQRSLLAKERIASKGGMNAVKKALRS